MSGSAAPCKALRSWLLVQGRRSQLAALTGQDSRALDAIAHLAHLYAAADREGRRAAVSAIGATVEAMQPHLRPLALDALTHATDSTTALGMWAEIGKAA